MNSEQRDNHVRRLAAQIMCAEIANGPRQSWLYQYSPERLDQLVEVSVTLAEKLIKATETKRLD